MGNISQFFSNNINKAGISFNSSASETFDLPAAFGTPELGKVATYIPGLGVCAAPKDLLTMSNIDSISAGYEKASKLIKISSTVYILAILQKEITRSTDGNTYPFLIIKRLLLDQATGLFSVTQSYIHSGISAAYLSANYSTNLNSFSASYSFTTDTLAVYYSEDGGGVTGYPVLAIFKNVTVGTLSFGSNIAAMSVGISTKGTILYHPNYQNILIGQFGNTTKTFTVTATGAITLMPGTITSGGILNNSQAGALEYYTGDLFVYTDNQKLKLISVNSSGVMTNISSTTGASLYMYSANKIYINTITNKVYSINGNIISYCNINTTTIGSELQISPTGLPYCFYFLENVTNNAFFAISANSPFSINVLTFDVNGLPVYQGSYNLIYKGTNIMPSTNISKIYYENGNLYLGVETIKPANVSNGGMGGGYALLRTPLGSLKERYIGKYINSTSVQAAYSTISNSLPVHTKYDNKTIFAIGKAMLTYSTCPVIKTMSYTIAGSFSGTHYIDSVNNPDIIEIDLNTTGESNYFTYPVVNDIINKSKFNSNNNGTYVIKFTEYQYDL